ncbi:hypothetical protein EMIHUDRAFT_449338 [Emiliania huxleyi CCMP1516]|uniref:Uncharacterized protein n=2 Tax=Emiliania huxleyi TaxID=2903 RepID=A0A0D3KEX6_EMIH1|nr:hypothetical protein EMIHUDRAFT_449338 [Emiliania huxleyi CCMP1516]EOD34311.1 hypothetical protein EMIHUDRAFT_449338 [Emiliania huxleyi CCMP1516]|eukprot:XP_005786740.1 hypothetical protein EMIHUDRAFT_449338 [Emiliania huxleyi CCMP1516]
MAASGSSRRRKKAPGSLLNKLFALGCLASLLPLYYEYHYTTRSREHLPHVPHDDPFIRVIDAAGPFDEPGINHSTEAALKLSFYVAFMFRSRAALSMLSMRFLSLAMMRFVLASNELAMMLFMLASMNAAKREQQRRLYALHGPARRAELALHGYDEHGRPLRRGPLGSSAPLYASLAAYPELGVRREAEAEAFWDSFESGRRGRLRTYDEGPHGLLLQILALDEMLTRLREGQDGDFSDSATGDESDEDDRRSPSPDR